MTLLNKGQYIASNWLGSKHVLAYCPWVLWFKFHPTTLARQAPHPYKVVATLFLIVIPSYKGKSSNEPVVYLEPFEVMKLYF